MTPTDLSALAERLLAGNGLVKPLEWQHYVDNAYRGGETAVAAPTLVGRYQCFGDGSWADPYNFHPRRDSTLDEAKAAAQADCEARIRSALDPDTIAALASGYLAVAGELEVSQSKEAYYAKVLFKFRNTLLLIQDHIEDEGDRAYFGSTNHAEELREIAQKIDGLKWDKIMESSQPKVDLYALLAEERVRAEKAEAERDGWKETAASAHEAFHIEKDKRLKAEAELAALAKAAREMETALTVAAERLTWAATANPGVRVREGKDLVLTWAADTLAAARQTRKDTQP